MPWNPHTKVEIEDMADRRYAGDEADPQGVNLFNLLVQVADVYLQSVEAQMPADEPGSPFIFGAMPIDVVTNGLRENLQMKQDEGRRVT